MQNVSHNGFDCPYCRTKMANEPQEEYDEDDVQVVKRWTQTQAEALQELETLNVDAQWLSSVTAHLPTTRAS